MASTFNAFHNFCNAPKISAQLPCYHQFDQIWQSIQNYWISLWVHISWNLLQLCCKMLLVSECSPIRLTLINLRTFLPSTVIMSCKLPNRFLNNAMASLQFLVLIINLLMQSAACPSNCSFEQKHFGALNVSKKLPTSKDLQTTGQHQFNGN